MNRKNKKQEVLINEQIKFNEVRLTGNNVENKIYKIGDANKIADEKGLDLILITTKANPPVCKVEDYKKYLYELKKKKKEQERKSKQNQATLKEIRFGPNTDDHDFNFKKRHAENFLKNGDRLKAYVFFKGREMQHKEKGQILLLKLADQLSEVGIAENMPKMEGNRMIVFFKPKK